MVDNIIDKYKSYFGENYKYYQEQIESNKIRNWNWASFFLGAFWLIYRKIYSIAIIYILLFLIEDTYSNYLDIYGLNTLKVTLFSLLFSIITGVLLGVFGNRLVISNFKKGNKIKNYNKRKFKTKSTIMILSYLVIYISLSFVIETYIQKKYDKNVFTIKNVLMMFSSPIMTELSDNSLVFIYKANDGTVNESSLIFSKRINNETTISTVIGKAGTIFSKRSLIYDDPKSKKISLILFDNFDYYIFLLSYSGEVISKQKFPAFIHDSLEINDGKISFVHEEAKDSYVSYSYNILQNTISKIELKNYLPLDKISNSNKFYNITKDGLNIFSKEKKQIQTITNVNFKIFMMVEVYEFDSLYIIIADNKIYAFDKNNYELIDIPQNNFNFAFINTDNKEYISIWGTSKNMAVEKIKEIRIDKNINHTQNIIKEFKCIRGYSTLSYLYDSQKNITIGGISDYNDLFIIKINNENELVQF